MPRFVEGLRRLILSHATHDDPAFRQNAEQLIRELSVTNRPGEAKALRDALDTLSLNGKRSSMTTSRHTSLTNRSGESLITLLQPRVLRDAVILMGDTRNSVEQIIAEHRGSRQLAEAGLSPKSRIVFWGPPGCGKTKTAELIALELGYRFGVVRLSSVISSFVGETASNLQRVFNLANNEQMVLLFDEADALAKNRDDRNDVGELKRVVNSLLQSLDQLNPRNSIVILASNHQHLFDAAVWRRFDDVVNFPLPSESARLAQLKYLTSGLRIKGSLKHAANKLRGASFADVERAVLEVAKQIVLSAYSEVDAIAIVEQTKRWRVKYQRARKTRSAKS